MLFFTRSRCGHWTDRAIESWFRTDASSNPDHNPDINPYTAVKTLFRSDVVEIDPGYTTTLKSTIKSTSSITTTAATSAPSLDVGVTARTVLEVTSSSLPVVATTAATTAATATATAAAAAATIQENGHGLKFILLVDDVPSNRKMLQMILSKRLGSAVCG